MTDDIDYPWDYELAKYISESNRPAIEYFCIRGLHGTLDITLNFSNNYNIFIADNGSGKTTALSIFHSLIKQSYSEITKVKFSKIDIKFRNKEQLSLRYDLFVPRKQSLYIRKLADRYSLTSNDVERLAFLAANLPLDEFRIHPDFRSIATRYKLPTITIYERFREAFEFEFQRQGELLSEKGSHELRKFKEYIEELFPHKMIYLPTYRRVEQDLQSVLSINIAEVAGRSNIHFGMRDVRKRIDNVTQKVRDHLLQSYKLISGQMLGQLTNGINHSEITRAALANHDEIALILGRVGESVSASDRHKILSMVDNKNLVDNEYLAFFISKLMDAYDTVKELDVGMKEFAKVCSGYLTNKKLVYDGVEATVKLHNLIGSDPLDIDNLSSGEKQILGVMSELYLGEEKSYIIIFDEPELSLSVEWQTKLLPDIIRSKRCAFMVAATHSPFVFQNELDPYARSLKIAYH